MCLLIKEVIHGGSVDRIVICLFGMQESVKFLVYVVISGFEDNSNQKKILLP